MHLDNCWCLPLRRCSSDWEGFDVVFMKLYSLFDDRRPKSKITKAFAFSIEQSLQRSTTNKYFTFTDIVFGLLILIPSFFGGKCRRKTELNYARRHGLREFNEQIAEFFDQVDMVCCITTS